MAEGGQVDWVSPPAFHNTIPLQGDALSRALSQCRKQEDRILLYFQVERRAMTPEDVLGIMRENTPLTSVRRAMSNLTERGLLRKLPLEERFSMGNYGKPVHSWELAVDA